MRRFLTRLLIFAFLATSAIAVAEEGPRLFTDAASQFAEPVDWEDEEEIDEEEIALIPVELIDEEELDEFDPDSLWELPILRAQIDPPVVSPTSSTQYGTYTYDMATADNPPVTMQDPTTFKRVFKYQQDCSKSFAWIPRTNKGLGLVEGGTNLYFAIPCETLRRSNVNQGVLSLAPSFDFTNIAYPKHIPMPLKLPKNVFNAGLATGLQVAVRDIEAKVEVKVGVASDIKRVASKAIYVRGRAEVSLPIDDERTVRALGGVAYYGRNKYKILPVAGLVWSPNPQNELRLVFPDPRWGHFLGKVDETDWWFYVQGNIGGDRWLMRDYDHKIKGKTSYRFDYDDYRVTVGLRFDCPKGIRGSFEVGGAFGRELVSPIGTFYKPKSAVILGAGLFF